MKTLRLFLSFAIFLVLAGAGNSKAFFEKALTLDNARDAIFDLEKNEDAYLYILTYIQKAELSAEDVFELKKFLYMKERDMEEALLEASYSIIERHRFHSIGFSIKRTFFQLLSFVFCAAGGKSVITIQNGRKHYLAEALQKKIDLKEKIRIEKSKPIDIDELTRKNKELLQLYINALEETAATLQERQATTSVENIVENMDVLLHQKIYMITKKATPMNKQLLALDLELAKNEETIKILRLPALLSLGSAMIGSGLFLLWSTLTLMNFNQSSFDALAIERARQKIADIHVLLDGIIESLAAKQTPYIIDIENNDVINQQ